MKNYKILFADLDGTLIKTKSGEIFPKGIWDMEFRFEVLDAIKKKDKEAFKEWDNQSLEDKMQNTDTRWYKSKLQFITIDEKTEKEKRSNVYYLVEGCSLESARRNIDEVMGGTMIDYSIASVSETPIMDVFEYKAKLDK